MTKLRCHEILHDIACMRMIVQLPLAPTCLNQCPYVWLLSAGVEARKSVLATARSIQSYKGHVFMRTWTLLSRR